MQTSLLLPSACTIFDPMRESKFVKTKIVAGYLVLLAVLFVSVSYVYRTVVRVSAEDDAYAQLQSRHNLVSQTLYRLYQAESYGQLMLAGYQSYERLYRRELNTVRACIDSLRRMGEQDSLQTDRLDSIARLVDDKQRRTTNLRRSIRSGGTAGLLDKNIEELIRFADTLPSLAAPAPPAANTVEQDTVHIRRQKRRFFRRVADLFSPPKEDSSIVISQRVVVDTLSGAADLRDTITTVLRSLQDRVTGERIEIYEKAWNEGQRLRYSNDLVNAQIYRLITDFEQEENAYLQRRVDEAAALRRRASQSLGAIAIGAVVLMLLFVAVLWRDVSRSNRYKRQLEQANRDKQALLDAREQLMLAITHDIKAPLGTIMGYLDLLTRLGGGRREALYLGRMQGASEHLLALVNSLLDFYRLDIRKIDLNRVAFSPAQLFAEIRAGFAPAAEAKGLILEAKIAPEAARPVVGDAFRIRQIADNLLSNALKFTDKGSVTLCVDRTPGRLVFRVGDTGRGIGREEKERIFQEFVRLQSAQGVDGFGLGLSIVDRLVKLLGGTIALESRPGRGTTFIVSLPVDEAPDILPQEAGSDALPQEAGPDGGGEAAAVSAAGEPDGEFAGEPAAGKSMGKSVGQSVAGKSAVEPAAGKSAGESAGEPVTNPATAESAGKSAGESAAGKSVGKSVGQPAAGNSDCQGVRLLLVDDDPLQLEMTAAMCRAAGLAAECCPDPRLAARLAAEYPFDAVLTDIQMPGADGFAVLAEIRRRKPGLPVIAVTARSASNSDDFVARGFAGQLHKPFSVSELIGVVCAVCGGGSAGRSGNPSAKPINPASPDPTSGKPQRADGLSASPEPASGKCQREDGLSASPASVSGKPQRADGLSASPDSVSGKPQPADGSSASPDLASGKPQPADGSSASPGPVSGKPQPADGSSASAEPASGKPQRADGSSASSDPVSGKPQRADGSSASADPASPDPSSADPSSAGPASAGLRPAPAATGPVFAEPAPAPSVPRFEALTAFAGDDTDAAREILRSFVEQNTENCRLLRKAAASGDTSAIRAVAHKMLPIFTMLDEAALAGTLRRLENAPEKDGGEMRREAERVAEKVMRIVREAQKNLSLP